MANRALNWQEADADRDSIIAELEKELPEKAAQIAFIKEVDQAWRRLHRNGTLRPADLLMSIHASVVPTLAEAIVNCAMPGKRQELAERMCAKMRDDVIEFLDKAEDPDNLQEVYRKPNA